MNQIIRVGKKRVIYIPKDIAEKLDVKEGDKMILEITGDKMILTPVKSRLPHGFWGEVSVEEVEEVGEAITKGVVE